MGGKKFEDEDELIGEVRDWFSNLDANFFIQGIYSLLPRTGNIFSIYFGGTLVIVLSGYDVLKEALVKQGDIFVDRPLQGLSGVVQVKNGIIGSSGSVWKENRTSVFQIFKNFGLGKDVISQKILEEVEFYLAYLKDLKGSVAYIQDITTCATANVTCNVVLGKRFHYDDSDALCLIQSISEYMTLVGGGRMHTWFSFVKYLPGDLFQSKRLMTLQEEILVKMRCFIENVKDEERKGLGSSNLILSSIEKLEEKQKTGQPTELSMYHLERIVFDLILGGSETTSTTLLWFYLYMVHFPDIQDKFYNEIIREIGTDRTPAGQDKVRLTYVNAVILETQRLATISPFSILHRCSKETTIAGYTIPKDVQVLTHLDAVMLDDEIWGDARQFRPERFLKEGKLFYPEQFVAFGLGKRSCPGESLAKMELFLFTVSLIQRFKIVPSDPNNLPIRDYVRGATCCPVPFTVKFVQRTDA
ncbi:cytochrome P450 2U1 [Elysia marginata]|uniref:Cytochrome P450 2U1 n=1 Tax=Elysia marginata TaxID=1093978 RepID=A0AAV4FQV8_9GAST|nr:cytochrome P450 2U1 [Elysia marginata]